MRATLLTLQAPVSILSMYMYYSCVNSYKFFLSHYKNFLPRTGEAIGGGDIEILGVCLCVRPSQSLLAR